MEVLDQSVANDIEPGQVDGTQEIEARPLQLHAKIGYVVLLKILDVFNMQWTAKSDKDAHGNSRRSVAGCCDAQDMFCVGALEGMAPSSSRTRACCANALASWHLQ
jgi:hypothetical protein